jgi:hypothetical protein
MKHSVLLVYQWITGLSDTSTGVLLYAAPFFTLRLMGVHAGPDALPYISFIGAFVLAVGLSCIYGALLLRRRTQRDRLKVVWLLTGFSRAAVAIYLTMAIVTRALEPAWCTVAAFDGACVVIQAVGLRRHWIPNAW